MHGLSEMLNGTEVCYYVDYIKSSGYSKALTIDVVQHKCKNAHFESLTTRFRHSASQTETEVKELLAVCVYVYSYSQYFLLVCPVMTTYIW